MRNTSQSNNINANSTVGAFDNRITRPKEKATTSAQLDLENQKMEERLKEVKALMELEKQKRGAVNMNSAAASQSKENTKWRSATTKQPIAGYDKKVMAHIAATKGRPPKPVQTNA